MHWNLNMGYEPSEPVYVRTDVCVRLGENVTCDGFDPNCQIRIQTHAHYDHLKEFSSSKSNQRMIVMTRPTMDLLVVEGEIDLPSRNNVIILEADGKENDVLGTKIALYPFCHMIGSVMPLVRSSSGAEVYAYSSDFSWPLTITPPKVDVLVVDALYGNPANIRDYNDQDAIDGLIEIINDMVPHGPVYIRGHRGRLQFVCALVKERYPQPIILGPNAARSIHVFCKHQGIDIKTLEMESAEATSLLRDGGNCFVFLEERDKNPIIGSTPRRRIWLTRFSLAHEPAVIEYDSGLVKVGLTDHADFEGTIKLIQCMDPKLVFANGARGGDNEALANYVRNELGLEARWEAVRKSEHGWGE